MASETVTSKQANQTFVLFENSDIYFFTALENGMIKYLLDKSFTKLGTVSVDFECADF